ncbi:MAG: MFS transporter [Myxococcales bacterium]|nr:MFS transporter [Myxococcales bacterium]
MLPVLVVAQFAGGSPWFAGNAVLPELQAALGVEGILGITTAAVQAGFITGTLGIAFTGLADRIPGRQLFAIAALAAAAANAGGVFAASVPALLASRFATGVALAGVYPVGMRLAASWSDPAKGGLGAALGYLVGALVLGTALPHGLRALGADLPWRAVLLGTSGLAAAAGIGLYATVRDGPFVPTTGTLQLGAIGTAFRSGGFRAAAFGYFGHMWELYAVWTMVPVLLVTHSATLPVSAWSFAMIGAGAVGCAVGGQLVRRWGSRRVAAVNLIGSAVLCATAPLWLHAPTPLFLALLIAWGVLVVGDSPQLSALTARTAPPTLVGSALTLTTAIGFGLTVISIPLAEALPLHVAFPVLAMGPVAGLLALQGAPR